MKACLDRVLVKVRLVNPRVSELELGECELGEPVD